MRASISYLTTTAATAASSLHGAHRLDVLGYHRGERAIYLRERMVNLRLINYVASKFIILAGVCVIQCTILLAILASRRNRATRSGSPATTSGRTLMATSRPSRGSRAR